MMGVDQTIRGVVSTDTDRPQRRSIRSSKGMRTATASAGGLRESSPLTLASVNTRSPIAHSGFKLNLSDDQWNDSVTLKPVATLCLLLPQNLTKGVGHESATIYC